MVAVMSPLINNSPQMQEETLENDDKMPIPGL